MHPGVDAYEEYDALICEAADVHAESYAAPPVEYGAWLNTAAAVLHAAAAEAIDEPPIELIVALPVVLELPVDEVVVVVVPLLPVVVVVVDMPVEPPVAEGMHEERLEHRVE